MKPSSTRTIARFLWPLAGPARCRAARQALVPTHSTKACRIAQDEVEAGKIAYVKKDVPVVKPLVDEGGVPIIS